MVALLTFLRNLFVHRKKSRVTELSSVPPPEYSQICAVEPPVTEKEQPSKEAQYLNPKLQFTADDIDAHLAMKDVKFAAAIVELMLPRLKLGVWKEPVGWGHYSYTLHKKEAGCHSDVCQCNKATGWDALIGFKAWEYSSRFKQVGELAKKDLELRGFVVDKMEVYTHKCTQQSCRGGVFVKWDVKCPNMQAGEEKPEQKEDS